MLERLLKLAALTTMGCGALSSQHVARLVKRKEGEGCEPILINPPQDVTNQLSAGITYISKIAGAKKCRIVSQR